MLQGTVRLQHAEELQSCSRNDCSQEGLVMMQGMLTRKIYSCNAAKENY